MYKYQYFKGVSSFGKSITFFFFFKPIMTSKSFGSCATYHTFDRSEVWIFFFFHFMKLQIVVWLHISPVLFLTQTEVRKAEGMQLFLSFLPGKLDRVTSCTPFFLAIYTDSKL